jgi:lantibiotic biosynthesis protein
MRSERDAFLGVAGELAHGIAASAVWDGSRCNWVGALPPGDPRGTRAIASLGADLYGGTSGVALFLAEAGARLDDDAVREAAQGAIAHALEHARAIRPEHRDGLYLGPIGVAYAAARVAELLGSAHVLARACELLGRWRHDPAPSASADVMSGCAGAVTGLVALVDLLELPWLLPAAVSMGDELLARARVSPAGWSWGQPGQRSMHHLCGLAHGAAGIGHAFAELFAATGAARFGEAAQRAFAYERSWLDPLSGTWPDLRGVGRAAGRDAPMPTADSWCNGSAGIALSRLRAAELLGSATLREEAALALAACDRRARELLLQVPSDFSLCHGAAGTGDVLLRAAASPDDPRARRAADIGRHGIEHGNGDGPIRLPCGVTNGSTPGLFLGLAGIGMFYLRLSDAAVAGPLLVHPRTGLTVAPVSP